MVAAIAVQLGRKGEILPDAFEYNLKCDDDDIRCFCRCCYTNGWTALLLAIAQSVFLILMISSFSCRSFAAAEIDHHRLINCPFSFTLTFISVIMVVVGAAAAAAAHGALDSINKRQRKHFTEGGENDCCCWCCCCLWVSIGVRFACLCVCLPVCLLWLLGGREGHN